MRTNRLSPGRITQEYKNLEKVPGKSYKMKMLPNIMLIITLCIIGICPFQNQFMDGIDKDFLAKGH